MLYISLETVTLCCLLFADGQYWPAGCLCCSCLPVDSSPLHSYVYLEAKREDYYNCSVLFMTVVHIDMYTIVNSSAVDCVLC